MKKLVMGIALFLACVAPARADEPQPEDAALRTGTFTLGPLHVDRKYPSMTGPSKTGRVTIGSDEKSQNIWIKSFRVDVSDDAGAPVSSEYLCHSWVVLGKPQLGDQRLMTVSQGLEEMKFPQGFAIKAENAAKNASILAQALNNNDDIDKKLSYTLTVHYVDDADAEKYALKPLRTVTVAVMAKDTNTAPSSSGDICTTQDGMLEPMPAGMSSLVHFNVPPGRHEYKSPIDRTNPIYMGGNIHYIKLHLHPYGESVTLTDKTNGKTVWHGKTIKDKNKAALTDADFYSSVEGIKIEPAHEYEITTVYNNTSNSVTDAMAVLRLYVAGDAKAF